MITPCPLRMVGDSSLACKTVKRLTTGFGVVRLTVFAVPGVGPGETGEASQFAGSLLEADGLTRSSERPLYWKV